jgi:hypothetical protein
VIVKILQNAISTVPIIYSSSSDGSFPQLLHLASLSGILKCKFVLYLYEGWHLCVDAIEQLIARYPDKMFTFSGICRYFKNSTGSLPILNQPVCTIPLGSWVPKIGDPNGRPLAMLRPNAPLSSARL